jgi:hypothetical protein
MPRARQTLATIPQLLREWHPTKNGKLDPRAMPRASNRKVWWQCLRDREHVYAATVSHRTVQRSGCPFCAGKRVLPSESLAARFPKVAAEWHPARNGHLRPEDVTPTSGRRVCWQCRRDPDHVWQTAVSKRTTRGQGCPFCGGYRVTPASSLAGRYPAVAAEWHPSKNGKLRPDKVSAKSGRRVWWRCAHNVKHTWRTSVRHRTGSESGCPRCYKDRLADRAAQRQRELAARPRPPRRVRRPAVTLAAAFPALAAQWHPTKNGTLTASDIGAHVARSVWWSCAVAADHQWHASIMTRTVRAQICPFCADRRLSVTNSLAARFPELVAEWHPKRNRGRKPSEVRWNDSDRAWWRCAKNGKHVFRMEIATRARGGGCPFCAGSRVAKNRSASKLRWTAALEWDRERNAACDVDSVRSNSSEVVWWRCQRDPSHRWQTEVRERRKKGQGGCPFCTSSTLPRLRTLAARNPRIAAEWHPTRNGALRPDQVSANSRRRVSWKCPEGPDHLWETSIASRAHKNTSCPFCRRVRVSTSTSLAALFPKVAAEWHPRKNGKLRPEDFLSGSNKVVWWLCRKGPDHDARRSASAGGFARIPNRPSVAERHEWRTTIAHRTSARSGCPFCAGQRFSKEKSLASLFPKVAAEWHPSRNGKLTPAGIPAGSGEYYWWRCRLGHVWRGRVLDRTARGRACPACAHGE